MKKIVLNYDERKYFMRVLESNGMINQYFDDIDMNRFLRELEEKAKKIAENRLPSPYTWPANDYIVTVECSELVRCNIADNEVFKLTFEKIQINNPRTMKTTLAWDFYKHNIFVEE